MYYAYGIRNSFGIDFDPLTGNLWDTENGPWYGDEINLVEPGFNSGWNKVQGIWQPAGEYKGKIELNPKLVDFDGKGKYSEPELMWNNSVGLSTIKFFNSDAFGDGYKNDLLVADVNEQVIYHFELNDQRTGLDLSGQLSDKIAHNADEVRPYRLVEGIGRVTDLEVGPDGNLYILSHNWDRESGKTSGMISRLISSSSASMDIPSS
jgi:glucose/arabinose dehydrogenase